MQQDDFYGTTQSYMLYARVMLSHLGENDLKLRRQTGIYVAEMAAGQNDGHVMLCLMSGEIFESTK